MAREERLFKLKRWLASGRCVTRDFLLRELEVSPATLKRDVAWLRDRLNTPVEWDAQGVGWRLDHTPPSIGPQFELPGLHFAAEEIHACRRRSKSDPPRRSNIDPGMDADRVMVGCGQV